MANGVGKDVAVATLGDTDADLWLQPGTCLKAGDIVTVIYYNI